MWCSDVTLSVFVITCYFTNSYCDIPVVQMFRRNPLSRTHDSAVKPYYWQDYEDYSVSDYSYFEYDDIDNKMFKIIKTKRKTRNYQPRRTDSPRHNINTTAKGVQDIKNTLRDRNTNAATDKKYEVYTTAPEVVFFTTRPKLYDNERGLCPDNKTCARKCCHLGMGFNETAHKCTPLRDKFNPPVWKGFNMMKGTKTTDELYFLFGYVNCKSGAALIPTTGIRLQSDGSLMVERTSAMGPGLIFKVNQYCMDLFITEENDVKLNAFICHVETVERRRHFVVIETCLVISCIFILFNVVVYALLPELRPRHKLLIIAYLISFLLCGAVKFIEIILILWQKTNRHMCLYFTFLFYFFFISGFFWRNIMCYDMWCTIRSKRPMSGQGLQSRIRLFLYFVYGVGAPGALTGILAALEFSEIKKDHRLMPNIQNEGCNALCGYSKAIYQYGPVVLLLAINLILFGLTILKINNIKKETKTVLRSQESNTHVSSNDKPWVHIYVKLFVVMLIAEANFTLDFMSKFFTHYEIFSHYGDLHYLTLPFILYLNFKCQGQTWKNIKTRYKLKWSSAEKTMSTTARSQESSQKLEDCQNSHCSVSVVSA